MLILKQNTPNSVPTPPAGKGTVFLNTADDLAVKTADGTVTTFPTAGGANTQVYFNDDGTFGATANFTFNKSTNVLAVSGNVSATNVLTNNLLYANGTAWDLSDPGGSNTQIQFNDDESFGGSANFVWDKSSNTLVVNGTSNVNGTFNVAGNITANNVGAGNLLTANFVSGTLTTNAQPNITSVGTLTTLATTGNAIIGGNLIVNGNITYVNVENFSVEDPIISIGGGANGDPLTTNDGKDRGTALQYYTSAPVTAFMGWDNGNGEFAFGSNVSISSDVVTYTTLGNVRASTLLGNVVGATANFTGNITSANANLGNVVTGNYFTGVLTYAAQPNVTSVGTLTSLQIGATADKANDFPSATTVSSQDNSGDSLSAPIGLVGEAVANSSGNLQAFGLYGAARANGAAKGTGVQGTALVTNTADTGAAVGVRGYATSTHSGGYNIGVLGNAIGSGVGNYAFYVQNGGIASIENATFWDLNDNSNAALTFNSTGKANIFGIETTDNAEGIFTSGYLNVTGNVSAGGVKTNNLYYANGVPWDLSDPGGSNTQIQFNDDESFGGSAAFTFNKTSNLVSMSGALSVTGNANVGNLGTGGLITATGNVSGGNLTTSGVVSATGNVSGGNLTTGGALSVTGNANVGNIGAAAGVFTTVAGSLTTAAQPNITSTGTLTSLAVTGNISAGNVSATTFTGALTGNATGSAATVTTNAQPNITSVGTLTSLAVTGNISAGNVSATTFTGALSGAATTAGTVTTNAQPNITSTGTLTSLGVSGNITAANITANTGVFTGNGSGLSAIAGANVTGAVAFATTANAVAGANVSGQVGNALVAGTVYTAAQPNITSVGTLTSLGVTGNITAANITANSGVFTGNGNGLSSIVGANVSGAVAFATTANAVAGANVSGQVGNALVAGTVYTNAQPNITSVGTLTSATVSGNVTAGNVYANSGTIGASLLTGTLTTAAQPNITSTGTLTSLTVTGTATAGNLSTGGTLSVTGNANVGNLGTAGLITASGNVSGGNLTTGGLVNATGNIVSSANVVTDLIVGKTSSVSITATGTNQNINLTPTGTGTVNVGNFIISNVATPVSDFDAATKKYVDDVSQGLNIHDSCNAATTGTLATISGGVVTYNNGTAGVGATLTTTGTYTTIDGVTLSNGMRILVKNEATAANNGIYVRTSATVLTRATDFNTVPEIEAGDFTFVTAGTLYDNTGWVQTSTVTTIGTDPIDFTQFSGAGTYTAGTGLTLTGSQFSITNTAVSAGSYGNGDYNATFTVNGQGQLTAAANVALTPNAANLSGTVLKSTVVTSNLTSVGTLTTLNVSGNANVGNIGGAAGVFTTVAGSLTTASQPNITSVGTLGSLAVTGNISAGNVSATTFTGALTGAATTAGTVTTAAQPNITSVGTLSALSVTATITGNVSGSAATITTAAQPNITSVGTLSSLGVSGAVTASTLVSNVAIGTAPLTVTSTTRVNNLNVAQAGVADSINVSAGTGNNFIIFANAATGNITELTSTGLIANLSNNSITATTFVGALSGAATSATTAGTVTTAAQSNITSVGTLTSLDVSGTVTASAFTANTGVFTGNGSALTALNASNISSGTLAQARLANASVTLGSTALTLGSTVTTVAGLTSVTSTTFVGALTGAATSATTAGTVTTAAQPNITSVGTLTSLAVTGNVTAGNLIAGGGAGGNITGANLVSANFFTGTLTTAAQPNITSVGTLTGLTLSNAAVISVGSNTNVGTLTGNFSLSAGSKLNATYADLAERYVADLPYEPGTVLTFGGDFEVSITGEADSTRVAGVVSTNPAYLMNSECEGEHLVDLALMGRVPCKVIGPIVKGDLITTSEIAGFGKANNEARAGTIIGKALENYNGPTPDGLIEVLVGRS